MCCCLREVCVELHLVVTHALHYYYDARAARDHMRAAQKQCSVLDVRLTGAMGKRTRFQRRDLSQLVLYVDRADAGVGEANVGGASAELPDKKELPTVSVEYITVPSHSTVISLL
jgi:hypothetical protein